ncbi:MAG: flavodoxin [Erysipelotrichaceae bacterium]|jgi:flavodoxin|nr:flavodoxin [Erysipelotrichaceae bacterium]
MKNLVIYYSRSGENYVNGKVTNINKGNTEYVAEFLRDNFGADLFRAETVKEYAKSYMDCIREAQKELDNDERPQLKKYLTDISEYDNVFIAGPCWWGTYPMAVFSAIEGLDFAGKKIFPIMTHEGSGMGHCEKDLKEQIKGARFVKGLAIHGADAKNSEQTVVSWVNRNL